MENTMESLEEVLLDIINKTVEATGSATDFIVEQTPDVIQQLLVWKMAHGLIGFVLFILFVLFVPILGLYNTQKKDGCGWEEPCYSNVSVIIGLMMSVLWLAAGVNLDWLQIWLAPKVYLIEYAASLVH